MYQVHFSVDGVAQPQGSISVFNGRPTSANPKLKVWRRTIKKEAEKLELARQFAGPIGLTVEFRLPRPQKYMTKKWFAMANIFHAVRPDLDKLVRAICDALTDANVWEDDGRVCQINAKKLYVNQGSAPGVSIKVIEL